MIHSFYLNRIAYYSALTASALFVISYFIPVIFTVGLVLLSFLTIATLIDSLLLYSKYKGIDAFRSTPNRFSNGDENKVSIELKNEYGFTIRCKLIDELPFQFQNRKWIKTEFIDAGTQVVVNYFLHPLTRGEYSFGNINVFISSPLRLVTRRYSFDQKETVKVYPSYIQMRRYQLLATANRLNEAGVKRLRKLGHSMEFEQIKEYVIGDDYRTINWKATARHSNLMVNNYTDERSQQIYCIINKGRIMKMPFDGMTLLDYSVNASLVLLNIALMRQDKAGLIAFAENIDAFLPADKKPGQLNLLIETLYKQETNFLEPDFEKLFSLIRNNITQRSLLILFTNFESMESLHRELASLKRIAHYHLLMVVFFENTELKKLTEVTADTIEGIYIKTIAEKYALEKKLMVKELRKAGIVAVLTTPQNLTINSINKYLELKNRQSI
ncbi:MAG: DUF58 domain-containing protein [Bacteroidota bacterium]|nr:DUF58 domain-containing protein [Bacteroidota bacterium]